VNEVGTAGIDLQAVRSSTRTPAAARFTCLLRGAAGGPARTTKGKSMVDDLLHVGLRRLQARLSSVVKPDAPLNCWLIEWRNNWASRQSRTPGLWDETVVWDSVDDGDVDWKLDGNESDSNDCELFRELHISTLSDESPSWDESLDTLRSIFWDTLQPIFVDAGNLLPSILANAFPVPISSETLKTGDSLERWLYFLFDLAWAKIPTSPLRVSIDKEYRWIPTIKQFTHDIHGNTPKPDCRCSLIEDVVQASLYAIDILLTMKTDSQTVAVNDGKPAGEIEKGERNDEDFNQKEVPQPATIINYNAVNILGNVQGNNVAGSAIIGSSANGNNIQKQNDVHAKEESALQITHFERLKKWAWNNRVIVILFAIAVVIGIVATVMTSLETIGSVMGRVIEWWRSFGQKH